MRLDLGFAIEELAHEEASNIAKQAAANLRLLLVGVFAGLHLMIVHVLLYNQHQLLLEKDCIVRSEEYPQLDDHLQ